MAKANGKAGNEWKGIPAKARSGVVTLRRLSPIAAKETPLQVYREMVKHHKAMARKQVEEAKAKEAQAQEEVIAKRQLARNTVDNAMCRMAEARDILSLAEEGEDFGLPAGSLAYFVRVGIVDAMKRMEDALVDLGIVDKDAEFFVEHPNLEGAQNIQESATQAEESHAH